MPKYNLGEPMEEYAKKRLAQYAKERQHEKRIFGFGPVRGAGLQPTFDVLFKDIGAGQVSIIAATGGVTGTFTRATTATTINVNGTVVSVASGIARSYYDPTSLQYLGYLAEGARTNLALQSEDFGTTWTVGDATITANNTTAPDGAATADKFLEAATTAEHFTQQAFTGTVASYTASVWIKGGLTRQWVCVRMFDGSTFTGQANFDVLNGVLGTVTSGSATIKAYPSGWYRCTVTATMAVSATCNVRINTMLANDTTVSFAGNAANGCFLWGGQVELGAFASSYIPTTVATVTRNADVLTYPITVGSTYTMFMQASIQSALTAGYGFQIDDGTNNNRSSIGLVSGTTKFNVVDSTATQVNNLGTRAPTVGTQFKMAAAIAANDFAVSTNGLAVETDVAGTIPTGVNTVYIGGDRAFPGFFFSPISRTTYFDQRLANSALQGLTA